MSQVLPDLLEPGQPASSSQCSKAVQKATEQLHVNLQGPMLNDAIPMRLTQRIP